MTLLSAGYYMATPSQTTQHAMDIYVITSKQSISKGFVYRKISGVTAWLVGMVGKCFHLKVISGEIKYPEKTSDGCPCKLWYSLNTTISLKNISLGNLQMHTQKTKTRNKS